MKPLEKNIEKSFYDYIENLGYIAIKLELLRCAGFPDRMIIGPDKFILFLEFKRAGNKASKLQQYRIDKLNKWGFPAYVVYNKSQAIEAFNKEIQAAQLSKKGR